MKYCVKCGSELFDEAIICPKCGVPTDEKSKKNKESSQIQIIKALSIFVAVLGAITVFQSFFMTKSGDELTDFIVGSVIFIFLAIPLIVCAIIKYFKPQGIVSIIIMLIPAIMGIFVSPGLVEILLAIIVIIILILTFMIRKK